MTNRFINDTIYSHIEYTALEGVILQTKILSRLQFITQNALAYFSFPSITTKRYIHSLGTMHLASHMYKSALLNAKPKLREKFLADLYEAIKQIQAASNIDKKISKSNLLQDDSLYQFLIPLRNNKEKYAYLISLQAVRLAGLLHDAGHLPFSHQVEYAMQSIYDEQTKLPKTNHSQKEFIRFYETITENKKKVLHEAMGHAFADMLFAYEIDKIFDDPADKNYIKIVYKMIENIFKDELFGGFDFGVLHDIIDSTVDADRLDYVNRDILPFIFQNMDNRKIPYLLAS